MSRASSQVSAQAAPLSVYGLTYSLSVNWLSTTAPNPHRKVFHKLVNELSAYDAAFLFGLAAAYSFLLYVHQVTVHAWSPCKRRHYSICVPVLALLVFERLPVENLAVLEGNFAVSVGAHFVWQLGHGEESLKHLVYVGVFLC